MTLDLIDTRRVRELAEVVRSHRSEQALRRLLPERCDAPWASLAAHCHFGHAALLLFPRDVEGTLHDLRSLGCSVSAAFPSVVVEERLCRRYGVPNGSLGVQIVLATLRADDGRRRDLELFLLPAARVPGTHMTIAAERIRNAECHFGFHVEHADEVILSGLRDVLIRCGMRCDGGGFNHHQNRSVLYFAAPDARHGARWPGRLEVTADGSYPRLLDTHLSRRHAAAERFTVRRFTTASAAA